MRVIQSKGGRPEIVVKDPSRTKVKQPGGRMKVTEENLVRIPTWAGIALLVIAANLSKPPSDWLILPAWLILAVGTYFWASRDPEHSPYKQAFIMTFAALVLVAASYRSLGDNPFLLLFTEPSLAHLFRPRPFYVLVIIYLGLVCVFLNIKIQRLERDIVDWRQRYASLRDTLAGKKALDIFTPTEVLNLDIERLAGEIRDYKKGYAEFRDRYNAQKQGEEL